MPRPPSLSGELGNLADSLLSGDVEFNDGFKAVNVPSHSGLGTRQGRLPNLRTAVLNRKLVHWLVPEGPIIEMYINPQQIRYNYSKNIENSRTKGGFVIQYWGENLTILDIEGTTGTSGIEGINVLYDIYRNEQLAFDPLALSVAAQQRQNNTAGDIFGQGSALSGLASGDNFLDSLTGAAEEALPKTANPGPTLASLAMQVEMYWSGEVFRGYFNSFTVTEKADNLGMFDYSIKFTVTQKRGFRRNFLGWHKAAVLGASNSDPTTGPPPSFGFVGNQFVNPPRREEPESTLDAFESLADEVVSIFGG